MKSIISRFFPYIAVVMLVLCMTPATDAATVPASYQNRVEELQREYPQTRAQGEYGTCWAFSAVGLAEFDLIHDDGIADKDIDLSELQLAYFTFHNQSDPFDGTKDDSLTAGSYLMTGCNWDFCSRILLQWEGLIREEELPYTKAATIEKLDSTYAFSRDVAHLQNAYKLNLHTHPDAVKKEIMKHGAAGASLCMENIGRFDTTAYDSVRAENVATYYCPYNLTSNHAVNIVGWDDSFPAEYFKYRPYGDGAWFVRNSWTDRTGNSVSSYFWLSYYDMSLDDEAWIMDFEAADNYDFNYQYDGCASVYKTWKTPVCANVFQTKGAQNEQLRAVSVTLNEDENVPYTIKVYTNLSNRSDPRSGILAATVKGQTSYYGTYTIPLKQAVSLPKGTCYSVVVELGKRSAGIDMERTVSKEKIWTTAAIDYNQSFLYENGAWSDLAENADFYETGNLCIKAFSDKSASNVEKVNGVKKKRVSRNSAQLTWNKAKGAQGYEVYRATSKNGTYKKVATVTKNSCQNSGLAAKHTYYYRIRAYKKGIDKVVGALSAPIKVTTKR